MILSDEEIMVINPADDVVRDAERLDWLLKNPDVTVDVDLVTMLNATVSV